MGESARDGHYSAGALRRAIADVLRDGGLPAATRRAVRAAALSGLCIVSLVPAASALSLGELDVRSRLGQPLEAQLPLTLGPGESLAAGCISQGQASDGLARLPQLRIQAPVTGQAGTHTVRLATPRPLHEPMYGIELRVACPGTPVMVRQYVLMLDLPGTALSAAPATGSPREALPVAPAAARSRPAPASESRPAQPRGAARGERTPIDQGSSYRVAAGDTLSLVAQRVADRAGVSLWDMAARIQQANPSAFINGNPDLIRLGSELLIPVLGEDPAPAARTAAAPTPAAVVPPPLPAAPATVTPTPVQTAGTTASAAPGPVVTLPAAGEIVPASGSAPEAAVEVAVVPPLPAPLPEPATLEPTAMAPQDAAVLAPLAPARRGANPLLATAVGIGVGLLISLLFGRISLAGLRRGQAAATSRRHETSPAPVSRSRAEDEAGFTVVESPAQAARPVAGVAGSAAATAMPAAGGQAPARPLAGLDWRDLDEDLTDELSALFGDEDLSLPGSLPAGSTAGAPALSGDTVQATAIEQTDLDSIDPASTAEVSGLDWDALDVSVEDQLAGLTAAAGAGSEEPGAGAGSSPARVASTAIDLPALAASATQNQKLSESLIEALKMLEQDYQQEMTATQLAPMMEAESLTVEQPGPLKRQGIG